MSLPDNVDSNIAPFKSQAPDRSVQTRKAQVLSCTHVLVDIPTDGSLTRASAVAAPAPGFSFSFQNMAQHHPKTTLTKPDLSLINSEGHMESQRSLDEVSEVKRRIEREI